MIGYKGVDSRLVFDSDCSEKCISSCFKLKKPIINSVVKFGWFHAPYFLVKKLHPKI